MPNFFIDRPVFAWVVAILISLGGVLAILNLGVESYPDIAPPSVTVSASYPGASADTTEKTVTQVIEQQLTGIDHLLYFSSSSSASGRASITLTFESGTDPDIAQVQVQNKVALATPRLPSEVTQQGVVVAKANAGFLMVVALQSTNPGIDRDRLNDIVGSQVLDQISRVPGVGSTRQFGSEYAMRIWLNPDKLHGYNLSASQVLAAVRSQNVQFAAGALGADPAIPGQGFSATVSTEGRFTTPQQFAGIILRTNTDGTTVTLGDVARISFGPGNYGFDTQYDGKPIGAFAIQLLPGANALNVATAVRAKMDELAPSFPPGVTWFSPYDSTTFVTISINEVVHTLIEAIVLVFLVMLLFLQNFRATIIPTLVIPVALLGTFLGMLVLGFTINQLTLFGMVLAIGIVVDDAIVVIENVERIMTEEGLSPKDATRKAMGQITGAVVAITVVLAAVFVPSSLQPGASGIIYKQFALTIALSMGFSAFLALSFTPALCASFLQPEHEKKKNVVYRKFNRLFDWTTHTYTRHVGVAIGHAPRWMLAFVVVALLGGFLYTRLPGSFLPEEDQGYAMSVIQLPPGATKQRTTEVMTQMRDILRKDPAVDGVMQVTGFSFIGSGENAGMAFIKLKDWADRDVGASEFIQRANRKLHQIRDARIFVINIPTVQGLGQFGGFDMYLQDRSGAGRDALTAARNTLIGKANQDSKLAGVRPNELEEAPQLHLQVDRVQAQSMGLSIGDIYNAIGLMLAPVYVNDFTYGGRIKRVIMQADAPYRMGPDALQHIFTPSSKLAGDGTAQMIPLANVVHSTWDVSSPSLTRYRLLGGRGRRLAGARARLGRGNERDGTDHPQRPAQGLRLRLDRAVVPGDPLRQRGYPADGAVDLHRVPGAGRAVRKLVDPRLGAADRAAGVPGRGGVHPAARPSQRHLLQDRPDHGNRPGREKRDPDRGIRGGRAAGRTQPARGHGRRSPPAPAPDPDDLAGLHPRRVPAARLLRRRRQRTPRHRHRRDRRHAVRHLPRRAADPGVLRGGASPARRQTRWPRPPGHPGATHLRLRSAAGALTPGIGNRE